MADTKRTLPELQALLADNTAGDISPQDLRDMLVSIMGVYGSIVITAGVTGQTIASGVAEQMTEWTTDGISSGCTPAFASDQITIDNSGDYEIGFQCGFQGITNCTFEFTLYKNGVTAAVGTQRKTSNADVGSCSFVCQITLAATDVLSIWVEGDQNGTFIVAESQLAVKRIG